MVIDALAPQPAPAGTSPAHGPVHLRAGGVSLVITQTGTRMPRIVHWGADLGELDDAAIAELDRARTGQVMTNQPDMVVELGVVPEHSSAWAGTPGLAGHRGGRDFTSRFTVVGLDAGDDHASWQMTDPDAGLGLDYTVQIFAGGLVRHRATVRNTGSTDFDLADLLVATPVPAEAGEILHLTGRHLRERSPQRHEFTRGTHLREGRRGRTGMETPLVHVVGVPGFGFRRGEVWGQHVAWSGNWRTLAERDAEGVSLLAGGELLLSGEIRLAPGEEYTTPWVYLSYGEGLDQMADRFHAYLRSRPQHPTRPRPVTMNVWEAVYFDHQLDRLLEIAEVAAANGVERYVLDDGWFGSRRNDHAGLGDWQVSPDAWPDGLGPLVERVKELGMEFGLWVEPEMMQQDSELARRHPDWFLAPPHRLPIESRRQQVLDLAHPEASEYLFEAISALVGEYGIAYLKWDHNRDLVEPAHRPSGRAGIHEQTLATYALMDRLKAAHPGLEIESCSSGGARVDLGVLERTDRIWGSDCIDALERQQIQRGTAMLVPPELVGSHVGSDVAHTTGRRHSIGFRAGTALFGHFGIEWDLTKASPAELAELGEWIALYKQLRPLLHTGRVVHGDHPDPAVWVTGIVAQDGSRAVYQMAQVATSVQTQVGVVRLPGLDDDARYRVRPLAPGDIAPGPWHTPLPWWAPEGVELSGRALRIAGLRTPTIYPDRLVLLEVERV